MDEVSTKLWKDFLLTANTIFGKINTNKKALLAVNPVESSPIGTSDIEVLRLAIIAELDAVSLYEQLAIKSSIPEVITTLNKVAKEEKTHVGEFQALLLKLDPEYAAELDKGKEEVETSQ